MLNSFLGIGRIGQNAELTTTRKGDPMARFSIAIKRSVSQAEKSEPDWIRCYLFGDRARMLAPYLTKGKLVGVSGRLETYKTPEDGRKSMGIDVDEVNFLSTPKSLEPAQVEEEQEEMAVA